MTSQGGGILGGGDTKLYYGIDVHIGQNNQMEVFARQYQSRMMTFYLEKN
jgi:hypothetical protein